MKKGLVAAVALLLTVIPIHAEVVPEVSFSGGYTGNLFNDSTSLNDTYTAVSPLFKIYPSAVTQVTLGGSYTSYSDYSDLSNLSGNAGLTIIPDIKDSKLGLMFSANLSGRSYGEIYELYNSYGADASAIFSYSVAQQVTVRGGGSASTSQYVNSISGDSKGFGFFGGLNITPYGSNSLNFEAGFRLQQYVTGLDTVEVGGGRRPSSSISGETSDFQVANFSVRYSRPLGERTGLNAFYSERWFVKEADSIIYGFSIDFLSPWTSMWDGRSFGANIKNFPGLDFIIESGFSYTDKQYIKNLEIVEGDVVETVLQQREDERLTAYIRLQRPLTTGSGMMLRPSLQVRWVDNSSNMEHYDYSYAEISLSLLFTF